MTPSTAKTATGFTEINQDLHAYVDGELPIERVPLVEARMLADPQARVLVKALHVQRAALQNHYKLASDCPRTRALLALVERWPGDGIERAPCG